MKYKLVNSPIKEQYVYNLLKERGVSDISSFLAPTLGEIQNPSALDNIAEGAALLIKAATQKLPLLICVDCDVDGYTSATIMY